MTSAIAILSKNKYNNTNITGKIHFYQCNQNTKTWILFDLKGLEPGAIHGCHIHQTNDFSKGCESLGPHFNPTGKKHGSLWFHNDDRHAGDLLNCIQGDKYGNFYFWYEDNLIDIIGDKENSILNRSIVIHEKTDDCGYFRNQDDERGIESGKTGNASKRIACAEIVKSNEIPFIPDNRPILFPFMRNPMLMVYPHM